MTKTTFKFWKENKLDQEYTLTLEEIKTKYVEYLKEKDQSWVEYYGHQTVSAFIGDEDGLNSVAEVGDYSELQSLLMNTRHETYN